MKMVSWVCLTIIISATRFVFGAEDPNASNSDAFHIKLLAPGRLVDFADINGHFEYLLDHICEQPEYFNYLKARYFVFPVFRDEPAYKISPSPNKALDELRIRALSIKKINISLFERLEKSENYSPSPEEWTILRTWFRYMGALAFGERVINRTSLPDGGSTYRELFLHTRRIMNEPVFFRQLVVDYCQVASRPFQARKNKAISFANETTLLFMSEYLTIDSIFNSEPNFFYLYPHIINERF